MNQISNSQSEQDRLDLRTNLFDLKVYLGNLFKPKELTRTTERTPIALQDSQLLLARFREVLSIVEENYKDEFYDSKERTIDEETTGLPEHITRKIDFQSPTQKFLTSTMEYAIDFLYDNLQKLPRSKQDEVLKTVFNQVILVSRDVNAKTLDSKNSIAAIATLMSQLGEVLNSSDGKIHNPEDNLTLSFGVAGYILLHTFRQQEGTLGETDKKNISFFIIHILKSLEGYAIEKPDQQLEVENRIRLLRNTSLGYSDLLRFLVLEQGCDIAINIREGTHTQGVGDTTIRPGNSNINLVNNFVSRIRAPYFDPQAQYLTGAYFTDYRASGMASIPRDLTSLNFLYGGHEILEYLENPITRPYAIHQFLNRFADYNEPIMQDGKPTLRARTVSVPLSSKPGIFELLYYEIIQCLNSPSEPSIDTKIYAHDGKVPEIGGHPQNTKRHLYRNVLDNQSSLDGRMAGYVEKIFAQGFNSKLRFTVETAAEIIINLNGDLFKEELRKNNSKENLIRALNSLPSDVTLENFVFTTLVEHLRGIKDMFIMLQDIKKLSNKGPLGPFKSELIKRFEDDIVRTCSEKDRNFYAAMDLVNK